MKRNLWLTMVTCLAYCLDKELWKAIEYGKMADLEMGNLPGNPEIGPEDLLALNEALERLAAEDHTLTDLIKLHCFAGLSLPQVADMQGMSSRTAEWMGRLPGPGCTGRFAGSNSLRQVALASRFVEKGGSGPWRAG